MLAKFLDFVKTHKNDIVLGIIIFLLVTLSFAVGYITANYQREQPIIFEEANIK